jgi:molybdenum ABC transporter molybdate-binding protein
MKPLIVIAGLVYALSPWGSAPVALAVGLAVALLGLNPWPAQTKKWSRLALQVGVVLLGFSMDLRVVADAGVKGLAFAVGTIILTGVVGFLLGGLLGTPVRLTALLSAGTAICGGSAIAATGPAVRASDVQMSVALASVFVLNALALFIFPPLGHALGLSQAQFGTWAAVAIHDVSSVVGAAKVYGNHALQEATVVKLTRALWIAPVALALSALVPMLERRTPAAAEAPPVRRPGWGTAVPWFIVGFVLASLLRTTTPWLADSRLALLSAGKDACLGEDFKLIGKSLLVAALFLIGTGLSRSAVASVGWRPFVQAVGMWLTITLAALGVVKWTIPGEALGKTAAPAPITVYAAASLTEAFTAIGRRFEADGEGEVLLVFGGSNQLRVQLEEGAAAEVFASADEAQMDKAVKAGLVEPRSVRVFATSRLVVVVFDGAGAGQTKAAAVRTLADIAKPGVALVLADEAVPAGHYTRQMLDRLSAPGVEGFGPGFAEAALANVRSREQSVRAVLAKVRLGEADAGVVYASDVGGPAASAPAGIRVVDVPDQHNPVARFFVGVTIPRTADAHATETAVRARARRFVGFLVNDGSQGLLRAAGFGPADVAEPLGGLGRE